MSIDYTPVIDDLRAKHAAMGQLIAALENVQRLNGGLTAIVPDETPAPAHETIAPARASKRAPRETKPAKAETPAGWDEPVMRALGAHPQGLTLVEVSRLVDATSGQMFSVLKRLVRDGAVTKRDGLYRVAAKAAKEAP
jgi:hypothetical protein